ncbi:MAG: beta-ketoacyl-[acyl-carrier-protein] synthase II [Deltaproteobacteria bacterium]|nr:MAG: beta-ketoacyl-[acyl-carrier-protein] synthase II [Deltaproteobacteria bacterium]
MNPNSLAKVVVTGIGVVSPVGTGINEFWNSIVSGHSGISKITGFDTLNFPVSVAGEVKKFSGEDYIEKKDSKNLPLSILYAAASGKMALENAGLSPSFYNEDRFGIFSGNGAGGFDCAEKASLRMFEKKGFRLSPYFIPYFLPNMAAGIMGLLLNVKGPVLTFSNACASGGSAVGEAWLRIRHGLLDGALAGGTEAVITPLFLAGLNSMKALSKNNDPLSASRPFDAMRDGFVAGEGSAFLVLENEEKALSRGAYPLAEIAGYSIKNEAWHIAAPYPDGDEMAKVMKTAVESAGISPENIDYINAHGTSTILNDKYETMAVKKVFGSHARKLKISSTKSMTGHLLGAAGAVEAAVAVMAVKEGIIPPTINLVNKDSDCDLDYVPFKAVKKNIDFSMSNSFGFGGINTSLVFKKY